MGSLNVNDKLDGRYLLLEKKGQGSYGEVWRARDLHLDLEVAIKIYFSLDPKANEDLKAEYVTASRLNHPNLLRATYFGYSDQRSYIVMPYCPSTSAQMVGCCNMPMIWKFLRDVSRGLAYLHERDIIHHDIKPDNILVSEDGSFVISDFGVSTKTRSTLSQQAGKETLAGAIAYMGPEMFLEEPYSVKTTDIWALGASIYEILTNSLPFFGQGGAMQNNGAELPLVSFSFVSDDLVQLMRDCLAKEPWNRPFAHEIADYAEMVLDENRVAPSWICYFKECRGEIETPEPSQNKRWLWIVGAVAAVFTGVILILNTWGSPKNNKQIVERETSDLIQKEDNQSLALTTASFLKVNGQENPAPLHFSSKESQKTIAVETGGNDFLVDLDDLPQWMTVNAMTDTSFVIKLVTNKTANKRNDLIKVFSGELSISIPIVQDADQEMVKRSKLKPAPGIQKVDEKPSPLEFQIKE